eukprot:scaffold114702_cov75-Phaeocystis_antarctica.AAC.2
MASKVDYAKVRHRGVAELRHRRCGLHGARRGQGHTLAEAVAAEGFSSTVGLALAAYDADVPGLSLELLHNGGVFRHDDVLSAAPARHSHRSENLLPGRGCLALTQRLEQRLSQRANRLGGGRRVPLKGMQPRHEFGRQQQLLHRHVATRECAEQLEHEGQRRPCKCCLPKLALVRLFLRWQVGDQVCSGTRHDAVLDARRFDRVSESGGAGDTYHCHEAFEHEGIARLPVLAGVVRVKVGERREMREEHANVRRFAACCERQELAQGLCHAGRGLHRCALESSQQLVQEGLLRHPQLMSARQLVSIFSHNYSSATVELCVHGSGVLDFHGCSTTRHASGRPSAELFLQQAPCSHEQPLGDAAEGLLAQRTASKVEQLAGRAHRRAAAKNVHHDAQAALLPDDGGDRVLSLGVLLLAAVFVDRLDNWLGCLAIEPLQSVDDNHRGTRLAIRLSARRTRPHLLVHGGHGQACQVEVAADLILDVAHQRADLARRVRVLRHGSADELFLRRGLVERQPIVGLRPRWADDFDQLLEDEDEGAAVLRAPLRVLAHRTHTRRDKESAVGFRIGVECGE